MPTKEELGEGGWIIAVAETVINPVFARKEAEQCYSEEDTGGSMLQDRAI